MLRRVGSPSVVETSLLRSILPWPTPAFSPLLNDLDECFIKTTRTASSSSPSAAKYAKILLVFYMNTLVIWSGRRGQRATIWRLGTKGICIERIPLIFSFFSGRLSIIYKLWSRKLYGNHQNLILTNSSPCWLKQEFFGVLLCGLYYTVSRLDKMKLKTSIRGRQQTGNISRYARTPLAPPWRRQCTNRTCPDVSFMSPLQDEISGK